MLYFGITVAELKYGVENSKNPEALRAIVEAFILKFFVIPIYSSLDIYAKEKAKLRKQGLMIDDFDILIGATSVANEMIMVTNNVDHLNRLDNIIIENGQNLESNNITPNQVRLSQANQHSIGKM